MKTPRPLSPWRTFTIASIAVFLVSIDATVLYAAFPALRSGFADVSTADLSWVLNAYTVVYAALLAPAGRLADEYGRKRMFVVGVSVFLLASLGCGFSSNVALLIGARILQAIGAALLLPASLSIVLAAFPREKRAVAVSLWGAVGGLAAALGPSVGSWLIDLWGWQWAFFINLPLGAISLWRGARWFEESRNPDNGAPLDIIGVTLLAAGVGAVALGLVRSEALGWSSPIVLSFLGIGMVALGAFIPWARRAPSPAIDLSLFDNSTYRFVNLATLSFGTAFAMMFFTFFLFMTEIWHYPISRAGLAATPGPLFVVPVSILSGRFAARFGHKQPLVAGSVLCAAGGLWFFLIPGIEPDFLHDWLPGMALTGIGTGMVLPSLAAAAVARLEPNRFGIGSAVNQAVRQVGSVMGVALAIVLVGHAAPGLADFKSLFLVQIGLMLLTALLCAPIDTRPQRKPLPAWAPAPALETP
ncbi:MFS transporter [Methylocapsa sp. S129]|uniref:MFS transporter n=1 Tax=Methylocapsa sp. S129 TaxID=1641869 RepID=UPI00131CE889|nr:MFS transporter [Methylocapsa sp. S129]